MAQHWLLVAGLLLVSPAPALGKDTLGSHLLLTRYTGLPGRGAPPGAENMPPWGALDVAIVQTCKDDVQKGVRFPVREKSRSIMRENSQALSADLRPEATTAKLASGINDCLIARGMGQFSVLPVRDPVETPVLQ